MGVAGVSQTHNIHRFAGWIKKRINCYFTTGNAVGDQRTAMKTEIFDVKRIAEGIKGRRITRVKQSSH